MKAYKVFNSDWKCRDFQYKIGQTYQLLDENGILLSPIKCERGFHACEKVNQCFNYYSFGPTNKIAIVELSGEVIVDNDKLVSNIITIIEEVSWENMLKIVNSGIGNSGHSNSGDWNSGDWNSGNWNSGDRNSGHSNSGHSNSGHGNSGHSNSGNCNSGDRNSGDWNSCNKETGYFNSVSPNIINVFNTPISIKTWESCDKPNFIYNLILNKWISFENMTDEEKIDYPKAYVCQGYLKQFSYKEVWKNAFDNRNEDDLELLKALPNFDAKVFEEISGININDY